jgi:hypothetical protein
VWDAPIARARWAGRDDVPTELLAGAAADAHAKVRSPAAGNERLPLRQALRAARTCVPYGPLMVATRSDCPDRLAATLLADLGELSGRRHAWRAALWRRAPGLAGKPLAQQAALEACERLEVAVPDPLVQVLEPDLQDAFLAEELTRAKMPSDIPHRLKSYRGTRRRSLWSAPGCRRGIPTAHLTTSVRSPESRWRSGATRTRSPR